MKLFSNIKILFMLIKLNIIERKIQKAKKALDVMAEKIYISAKEIASFKVSEMNTDDLLEQYNDILDLFDYLKLVKAKDFSKDFIVVTYDFVKDAEVELKKRGYMEKLILANLYREEIFK